MLDLLLMPSTFYYSRDEYNLIPKTLSINISHGLAKFQSKKPADEKVSSTALGYLIFFLDIFHAIEVFEMFILRPKNGVICTGSCKNQTVCHW